VHRFLRTQWLIGQEGLHKLQAATVAVCGLGGVGGAAVEALARSGIGKLVIIDHDRVDPTNINRQLIAFTSTIGQPKVEVAAARLRDINPECEVIALQMFYNKDCSQQLFDHQPDYVVDAIDSVAAKVDLITECVARNVPIISSMGAGNKLDPTKFMVADISETHTCPLAKVVRTNLRKLGITRGVKTVFSTEQPRKIERGDTDERAPGSIAFVPPVAGYIIASVVIRDLLAK